MNVYIAALSDREMNEERKLRWGDYWFKDSLGKAITALGHSIVTDAAEADVLINLHGGRIQRLPEWTYNVLWIIGHPDAITVGECEEYDAVYSESAQFAEHLREQGIDCKHLPGASDMRASSLPKQERAVFVGNWRPGRSLPSTIYPLHIWGEGWATGSAPTTDCTVVEGPSYPHEALWALYSSSAELVNQTYPDMERWGFHNPRHYDYLAVRGEPHPTFAECAETIMGAVPERRDMLDLGAWPKPRRGMVGIDLQGTWESSVGARLGEVLKWDLENGLPCKTWYTGFPSAVIDPADVIVADNLLEHIHNLIPLMNDCHDALLPAGRMHIAVPNAANPHDAWADPTHVRAFVLGTFDYFNGEHQRWQQYGKGYGFKPWHVVYCREEGRFIRAMLRPMEADA